MAALSLSIVIEDYILPEKKKNRNIHHFSPTYVVAQLTKSQSLRAD